MKKRTCIFNILYLLIILLCTTFMQGMKSENSQLTLNCPLIDLPKETLIEIFSHCCANNEDKYQWKALGNSIKTFIQLSTMCKSFNNALTFETIGKLCKNYAQKDKDQMLKSLIQWPTSVFFNNSKRGAILILICAGADVNIENTNDTGLLIKAVEDTNDIKMIEFLFKHNADPNVKLLEIIPVFFLAKTIEIAQLFLNNKDFNVHALDGNGQNIIWHLACNKRDYSFKLSKLYLEHDVDAKLIWNHCCILHYLAVISPLTRIQNHEEFIKKAKLLMNVIPNMINMLDDEKKTPLDYAQKYLRLCEKEDIPVYEQLIALYKKYGAKTAEELPQTYNPHNIDALH